MQVQLKPRDPGTRGAKPLIEKCSGTIFRCLEAGMSIQEACEAADITYVSVCNWIRRGRTGEEGYAEFAEKASKYMSGKRGRPLGSKNRPKRVISEEAKAKIMDMANGVRKSSLASTDDKRIPIVGIGTAGSMLANIRGYSQDTFELPSSLEPELVGLLGFGKEEDLAYAS